MFQSFAFEMFTLRTFVKIEVCRLISWEGYAERAPFLNLFEGCIGGI